MKNFKDFYKALSLNERINLKGTGAILNPWLSGECAYIDELKKVISLEIDFARISTSEVRYSKGSNMRIFFPLWPKHESTWKAMKSLQYSCPRHNKKNHSMYPANSFDMLNLGTCNH